MSSVTLTRRHVVAGLGAAGIGAAFPTGAAGLVSAALDLQVGDIAVTTLSDGHFDVPVGFFANVGPEMLEGLGETIRIGANVWVVRSNGRIVLIDAGSGAALAQMFPETGKLANRLAAEGIAPDQVADVVLTHMHADHIGGLVTDGAPTFPNAQVHLAEAEWVFWTDTGLLTRAPDDQKPLIQLIQALAQPLADRVVLHTGEADLGDGLTLLPAPGHTPGHLAVRLASGDTQFLVLADALIAGALQFAHPAVAYALDGDPTQAAATRRALFDQLAADRIVFAATHLAFPGAGMVERRGAGYAFVALD